MRMYVRYNHKYKHMFATLVRSKKEGNMYAGSINHTNKILRRAKLRRRNERYRLMFRFTAALLIVMTIATFTLSIRSFANERDAEPVYKYYTSYTVQDGDSIGAIADRYITSDYSSRGRYIAEVVSINHLISASEIYPGQKLIFPYYAPEVK